MNNVFSPVIIPTLNRYNHLRRCVESLARCTHAKETELIIGLDYPPSEKYEEGWEMICDYLPTITGFKKVTILKRDHNLGAFENMNSLFEYVEKYSDRCIFTEDDNEFSPNFLEFINKGLDKYKDNPEVLSISGYNYPINMEGYDKNIYASFHFSAWGCGFWKDKRLTLTSKELLKFVFIPTHFVKLLFKSPEHIISLLYMVSKNMVHSDACYEIFSCVNNKVSIFPSISKVRNWGHDGSGEHGEVNPNEDLCYNQTIDMDSTFDYNEISLVDFKWQPLKDYFHTPFSWYFKKIFQKIINK